MQGDGGRDERAPADSGLRQRTACNPQEMLNQARSGSLGSVTVCYGTQIRHQGAIQMAEVDFA